MTYKKIPAVAGATGAQGGGLARVIMDDQSGGCTARVLTHNPDSLKAKEFAALGAEVVRVDPDHLASVGTALGGIYGAFVVTNFWE